MSKTSSQDTRQLRAIGHKLKPVVTIAGKGLSDTVLSEIDRALTDHELIKIKLAVGDKEARTAVGEELCQRARAEIVQSIGNMILVLRRTKNPDPRKSNLMRPVYTGTAVDHGFSLSLTNAPPMSNTWACGQKTSLTYSQ